MAESMEEIGSVERINREEENESNSEGRSEKKIVSVGGEEVESGICDK